MNKRILVLEDDDSLSAVVEYSLKKEGYNVDTASNGGEGLSLFEKNKYDLIITDVKMPGMDGLAFLKEVKKKDSAVPILVMTAFGTIDSAVSAMREGAYDYIQKPFSQEGLALRIKNVLEVRNLYEENLMLREELEKKYRFENIVGNSEKMIGVLNVITKLTDNNSNVLILGESGTGKELVARAIHYNSIRKNNRFVVVNCATIPEEILESELFGHTKGSFTGAVEDKVGKFETADKGTLFLDEIGEMKPDMQAKLLRAIQEKEIERVGSNIPLKVDARIISATNINIEEALKQKTIREDLYYRLNVITINLASLRERKEDIPLLVKHFLKKRGHGDCQIADGVMERLSSYDWPGNVRELENVIERALVLGDGKTIQLNHLPEKFLSHTKQAGKITMQIPDTGISLEEVEKDLIVEALNKFNGNQTKSAEFLAITRQALIYRMEKHGIR